MSSEKVKINKNQRRWHKYGKFIIGLSIAAAVIIVAICIGVAATGGKKEQHAADAGATESAAQSVTDEGGNAVESESATEAPKENEVLKLAGNPAKEKFTQAAAYEKSVFMGDVFVNGFSEYGLIDEYYIWSSNFFTTDKAEGYVKDVAELKPEKVFLMFGFDDSSSKKSAETISQYEKVIKDIKAALPDTKIYLISELPVSKEFDKEEGEITQAVLDEVNSGMEKKASELGVTYIDVATAFKSDGNIGSEYTSDGYHIKEEYYPFVLNGIAKLIQ